MQAGVSRTLVCLSVFEPARRHATHPPLDEVASSVVGRRRCKGRVARAGGGSVVTPVLTSVPRSIMSLTLACHVRATTRVSRCHVNLVKSSRRAKEQARGADRDRQTDSSRRPSRRHLSKQWHMSLLFLRWRRESAAARLTGSCHHRPTPVSEEEEESRRAQGCTRHGARELSRAIIKSSRHQEPELAADLFIHICFARASESLVARSFGA